MNDYKKGLEPLPLHEIFGIPLADLVKAETHAAQATCEFIEKVGFNPVAKKDHFGDLRLIFFNYYSEDSSGKKIPHQVQIPILALIPIPIFQIENAELEFNIAIEGIAKTVADTALVATNKDAEDWLLNRRYEFFGKIDTLEPTIEEQKRKIPKMRVKINVKQSDLPTGLTFLFRKMDENSKG